MNQFRFLALNAANAYYKASEKHKSSIRNIVVVGLNQQYIILEYTVLCLLSKSINRQFIVLLLFVETNVMSFDRHINAS